MGYQESFIYGTHCNQVSNEKTEEVFTLLREKNLLEYDERNDGSSIVAKITLKEDFVTNFKEVWGDKYVDDELTFPKGTILYYIVGERFPQRDVKNLYQCDEDEFDGDDLVIYSEEEEKEIIANTNLLFTEYLPSHLIFLEESTVAEVLHIKNGNLFKPVPRVVRKSNIDYKAMAAQVVANSLKKNIKKTIK
ncbi:hypothetical protein DRF69_18615 [Chryseobacterium sp. 5_R23647]|nr:hypothetical protein DRF69_18615 [Chryseobacterium sp. 5_R23647]